MKRRVVITGMGVVSALACKVPELWQKLLAGESGVHILQTIPCIEKFKVKIGGDVLNWDPEPFAEAFGGPREIKRTDRFSQFAQVAAHEAVHDCGIDFSKEDPWKCGVILGSGIGGLHAKKVSVSSTKSQLGHTLGASGGLELVATVKSICDSVIAPTINLDTPDPACDLDYTPNQPRERQINAAISNSFGFGGHNACIVVGKYR